MWFRSTRTDVEVFTPDTKSKADIYSVCRNGSFTIKSSLEASSRKKRKRLAKGGTPRCTNLVRLESLLLILLVTSVALSVTSICLVLKLHYGTNKTVSRTVYIQERLQAGNNTVRNITGRNITNGEMAVNKCKFHFFLASKASFSMC